MRIHHLLLISCLLIFISCERKSGRQNTGKKQEQTTKVRRADNSSTSINTTTEVSSKRNKRVLTGPEIFDKYNSAVFMVYTSDGISGFQGSGFFVSENGVAVSNYHVFKGTTKGFETIKLTDGRTLKVEEVLDYSESLDYIVFKVDIGNKRVTFIPVSDGKTRVGDKAYAIGSPRGLENTFSSGEISQIRSDNVLQISVPIDHGSSGGALLNHYGEVIGITTAGLDESGANLNFAMSINVVIKNIQKYH